MRTLVATLLLFFGMPQGAPLTQTGAIEGKIVRASNSEPISGVQVTLMLPAPQSSSTPQPAPPASPTQIQLAQTPQGVQLTLTTGGATTTQVIPAETFAALQRSGAPLTPETLAAVARTGAVPNTLSAVTDADGRFVFRNLAPGGYTIRAQRDGYLGPKNPQGGYPAIATKAVAVETDKTVKVDLGMVQAGVLRGIVRDPDGQPAANYAVVTARPGYANGRYIWLLTGARNADDRGEYRWPGFPPGEYYVGVGPRAPGPIANIQDSWARVFSPGVIDPNQARPVTIPEGGEVTVNLSAQVKPWGSFKISGLALNPLPNIVPDPATGIVSRAATSIVLMPLDLTPLDNPPVTMWTHLVATNTKPNGEFVLSNVDPGRYELYAMAQDIQNRRMWTGHMRVEVRDKDITGLNIPISPGVTLQGEVATAGSGTVRPEAVRIQLQSLGTLPPQVAMAVGLVPVDASGKFQIANLSEGRYRINAQVPPGAYVASIQQAGVNVFDDGFNVDGQTAQIPLRVEINAAGEIVEGEVKISQAKEASSAMVVLVPAPSHRNNPAFYKTAITDATGHFTIRGVAPGAYTAFAWESVLPGAWQNAEFLEKHQSRGRPLTVQGGTRSEIQLDLIQ